MAESVKKWYVVRAIGGQEQKVKGYIETEFARLGLQDYLGKVEVPTETYVQLRNGKKVQRQRVHYPGYVMVEANLAGEVPHVIRGIVGVIGFLSDVKGGDPVPMRQSEVNRMLKKSDDLVTEEHNVVIPYEVNEMIKVINGPFNGFDAVIEEVNEERRKLKVIVKIFGRKTPVELGYTEVEKIS